MPALQTNAAVTLIARGNCRSDMALNGIATNDQDDEYDEEADSDFDGRISDKISVTSSDSEQDIRDKQSTQNSPRIEELDSGDEATIREQKKQKEKQKRKQDRGGQVSSDEEQGEQTKRWRAKTRSMRARDDAERRKKPTADMRTSTVDVDKLWEEMNKPGPLPPPRVEGQIDTTPTPKKTDTVMENGKSKRGLSPPTQDETITIKRQFRFAGELHTEEKVVPKSSAEARLWLAQQENKKTSDTGVESKQRPLRKISRFDPNCSNLEAFRNDAIKARTNSFKGPKLNVVEKSKMDWAAHVDAEGLKEELDVHAKAKDAYLNRMDFLGQVEQRKEEEARLARQKG